MNQLHDASDKQGGDNDISSPMGPAETVPMAFHSFVLTSEDVEELERIKADPHARSTLTLRELPVGNTSILRKVS